MISSFLWFKNIQEVLFVWIPHFASTWSVIYVCSAVCPYLALETCRQWRLSNKTVNLMRNGKMPTVTIEQAQKNYCKVCTMLLEVVDYYASYFSRSKISWKYYPSHLSSFTISSNREISWPSLYLWLYDNVFYSFQLLISIYTPTPRVKNC